MKLWKLESWSDFASGGIKPQIAYSIRNRAGIESYRAGGGAAFCLSDSFSGGISFCGGDLFAISVSFEGVSESENGSFGLVWDDVTKAYEAAGFVETDEEPMCESVWFNELCDYFVSWVFAKLD